MTLPPSLLAAAFVLAGAASYDPQVLVLTYADGRTERVAATSPDTCAAAIHALRARLWRPVGDTDPVDARCEPGDLFAPGAGCIKGFNC